MKKNYHITSVIAIAISLTSYIPVYDCTGVSLERCKEICKRCKEIDPEGIYTVVSGGTYDNCGIKYHVNDIDWGF